MELSPVALVLLGLLLAGWTFGAVWLVLAAQNRARQAHAARGTARRLSRMIEDSPAMPLVVRSDGRIEGRVVGGREWDSEEYRGRIRELLDG